MTRRRRHGAAVARAACKAEHADVEPAFREALWFRIERTLEGLAQEG